MLKLNLKRTNSDTSVVARELISKEVETLFGIQNYLPKVDQSGTPVFLGDDIFWSISHKVDYVFVGVSDKKIGVDIDILKERDESLLESFSEEEYERINPLLTCPSYQGEEILRWESFYMIWTAKEALIKYHLGKLDDMKDMFLTKCQKEVNKLGELNLDYLLEIEYNGDKFTLFSGRKENLFFSVVN